MPNLVGLRDMPPATSMRDKAREDTLKAMQMEALGLKRRDFLSTTDFKENKAGYVSTAELESQRLVNKGSIGKGEKSKLEGWNNAWTHLHDDGTDSQKLQDVNEGMGQTHRAKLMEDDSVREHTSEYNIRGPRGDRGDHGSRGGSNAGRATGRSSRAKVKEERSVTLQCIAHQPITRVRIPKRQRPTTQPDVPRRKPAPMMMAVSAARSAKREMNIPSVPVLSIQPPIALAAPSDFMAAVNVNREQPQNESSIETAPSGAKPPKEKAVRFNIGTSISENRTTTNISNKKPMANAANTSAVDIPSINGTMAAGKGTIAPGPPPKADLMDLDIGQETLQPVLQFTAPSTKKQPDTLDVEESSTFDQKIEALEKSGVLSLTQLEALRTIQAQVHARTNPLTSTKVVPHQTIHTESELKLSSPTAGALKVTSGIAKQFAEQQNAFLIGEHVHKTRYHTATSLTEDFEKLSILDKEPAEPGAMDVLNGEKLRINLDESSAKPAVMKLSTTEESKINPFSPPTAKGKGPPLPAHLLNRNTIADHGAAARTRYSRMNDILTSVSDQRPLGGVTAPARSIRRNKINDTGFIALAEKHAAGN